MGAPSRRDLATRLTNVEISLGTLERQAYPATQEAPLVYSPATSILQDIQEDHRKELAKRDHKIELLEMELDFHRGHRTLSYDEQLALLRMRVELLEGS
jgi:hypothetical protein